jgi:hypothetical protein
MTTAGWDHSTVFVDSGRCKRWVRDVVSSGENVMLKSPRVVVNNVQAKVIEELCCGRTRVL